MMTIDASVSNRVIVKVKDITYSTRADSVIHTANSSPGVVCQMSYDQSHPYVCVAKTVEKNTPK